MRKKHLVQAVLLAMAVTAGTVGGTAFAADNGLYVDQVGYLTDHDKVAMVRDTGADTFSLVDAATGKTVYQGKLSAPRKDANSEETLRTADFTGFEKAGKYRLVVGGNSSYPFAIGDNVYASTSTRVLRSYTLSRSGTPIDDSAVTGLKLKGGHMQDREASVYFTDKVSKKGDKVNVLGGWYDAGDYGKYTTTGSLAASELMLAYEANRSRFTVGQLQFPKGTESAERLPDVLSEVKYELHFLEEMQRKDGSTFHKVAGAVWPGFDKSPDTDTQPRFLYSTCTASTAMYGASLAIGMRVFGPFEPAYAAKLKADADKVWNYLSKEKKSIYRVDEGQESGSGPYNDTDDSQERLWFAAEMFRTTGGAKYENYLKAHAAEFGQKPSFFTWDNTLGLAQYAYLKADGGDAELKAKVKQAFLSYADEIAGKIRGDGFHCALAANEYTWASTKNAMTQADMLLMANEIAPKKEYVEGALAQVHYMLGRNALGKSFLTGVGADYPQHPHNRIHESTGAYVPGLLVGGPNAVSGGDPDQTAYLKSKHVPTAKSYLDVLTSWSTNEYAIDYTGAAAYALSHFAKPAPLTSEQLRKD